MIRLPLSKNAADHINAGLIPASPNAYEMASLLLLARLLNDKRKSTAAASEVVLGRIIPIVKALPELEASLMLKQVSETLHGKLNEAMKLASAELMAEQELLAPREWSTPSGEWIIQISRARQYDIKRRGWTKSQDELFLEQERIKQHVTSCTFDHTHVQGIAGGGKTTLIKQIAETKKDVIVITAKPEQLHELNCRVATPVSLCEAFIEKRYGRTFTQRRKKNWSFDAYARHYEIRKKNSAEADTIASLILRTIMNYCLSADEHPGPQHLPIKALNAFQLERHAEWFVQGAWGIWDDMIDANRGAMMPLPDWAVIKLAELSCLTISSTTLILDEQHDLSLALAKIIRNNSMNQEIITFGDQYQKTEDFFGETSKELTLYPPKTLGVTQSIRCGSEIASPVQSVLGEDHFFGNEFVRSQVIRYPFQPGGEIFIPEERSLIVTDSSAWLLVYSIKLAHKGLPFMIMQRSRDSARRLLTEFADLREGNTDRRHHRDIIQFSSWEQMMSDPRAKFLGFVELNAWIKRGGNPEKWESSVKWAQRACRSGGGYTIALVSEAKGHEWSNVLVTPDLAMKIDHRQDNERLIKNRLYTALTRARRRLYLPTIVDTELWTSI